MGDGFEFEFPRKGLAAVSCSQLSQEYETAKCFSLIAGEMENNGKGSVLIVRFSYLVIF